MSMIINETPVRTSKNFHINDFTLADNMPKRIGKFDNVQINIESKNVILSNDVKTCNVTYGLGEEVTDQIFEKANQKIKLELNSKTKNTDITFNLEGNELVDLIDIHSNEGAHNTVTIKYNSTSDKCYHNGMINAVCEKNSNLTVIIVNLINDDSLNLMTFENEVKENANLKYVIVDFGGKNSVSNYYSNISENLGVNELSTIYLGHKNQKFDMNYIVECRGEKTNVNIEAEGALTDESKKSFKGTIDFKKGCKKSKGDENEFCMLLSKDAKSLALPILLCSEEDVEGNHSSSAGKVGEKELFYIMSRGFTRTEAMRILVKAKFNKVLTKIKNEELKEEILNEIETRLN